MSAGASEVLLVANKPELSETGGGHGAKGVDFQRWWAVLRMVELEQEKASDFMLLFEAVQDVTELDSSSAPTRARIYQVKKKDRGEWAWSSLTGIASPPKPSSRTKKGFIPDFSKVGDSALGKLQMSLAAFSKLPAEAYFISNAGCAIPLATGGEAATSMPCSLADIAPEHLKLITDAFETLHAAGAALPDLKKVFIQKVPIHPDEPNSRAIAQALALLQDRSPAHAGQAASFVESLFTKIAPLGRKTDTCASFNDLVKQRGFSRGDFISALADLEELPDQAFYLNLWLQQLQGEGMGFMEVTAIRIRAADVVREQLTGNTPPTITAIATFCDDWIDLNKPGQTLKPYFDAALVALKAQFGTVRDDELMARFALRAIKKCVDQT